MRQSILIVVVMVSLLLSLSVYWIPAGVQASDFSGMVNDRTLSQVINRDLDIPLAEWIVTDGDQYPADGTDFVTCDDFNRTNGTVVEGWTEQSGDWSISSNELQSPTGTHTYITYDGSVMSGNFCVTLQAHYGSTSDIQYCAAMGWYLNESTQLIFKVQDNSSNGYYDAYGLYMNGTGPFNYGMNFGMDPIIQLEVDGTTAFGRIDADGDGVFEFEITHTVAPSSGLCGIAHYGIVSWMDDWCYGDECGGASPTPTGTPEPTPTAEPCIHDGDVNLDGVYSAGDAQAAFYIVLGLITPTFEQACAADCNGDDEITAG
ncbi:dockerin type I repeat-containing protein, partial [bacterium]|nr:dockerin type I repeat-containing protein [candidate division CSSED10-310 bacterium]